MVVLGLQHAVLDCGLIDMPLHGYPFTWMRFKRRPNCVAEILDRALSNGNFISMFLFAQLTNSVAPISDHSLIILNTEVWERPSRARLFKFENKWMYELSFKLFVK